MTIVILVSKEDEKIFRKALDKAYDNGFSWDNGHNWSDYLIDRLARDQDFGNGLLRAEVWNIIFDHRFAKAFWGTDKWDNTEYTCGGKGSHINDDWHSNECKRALCNRGWKFHLQQMVLEEEPLKYLEKFI